MTFDMREEDVPCERCCQIGNGKSSLLLPTWKTTLAYSAAIVSAMVTKQRSGPRLHYYIKEHMERLGVSDEDLANLLGIGRETVWKRYTDQRRLNPEKIAQMAEALKMHTSELLFPPDVPSLDAIAKDASDEQRAMAADILKRMFER